MVALAAVLANSATAADDIRAEPPPPCSAPPAASGGTGSWFRLDPVLEDGALVGQVATIGRADGSGWSLPVAPEAFVAPPTGGLVLVGSDDGRQTALRLVDAVAGCAWPASGPADVVVRRAVLSPDGRRWYEHRVDRRDRSDLGIWERDVDGNEAARVLPPIAPDARFGITWSTPLAWDVDGRRLVVQSCGQFACRTRVLDPATGATESVDDPALGAALGLAGDRLVVRGACRGLPCPVLVADLRGDDIELVADDIGLATMVLDERRRPTILGESANDGRVMRLDLATGRRTDLARLVDGQHLVTPTAAGAAELPLGRWLTSADGLMPMRGSTDATRFRLAPSTAGTTGARP
jgi:hypothetical protein